MVDIPELSELGMSKEDLARELGISRGTVYRWTKVPGYVEAFLRLKLILNKNHPEYMKLLDNMGRLSWLDQKQKNSNEKS